MENYLSIGEVSRLLNIPEHTLRYWQDAGIFSVRQEMNNYRKYTMADLLNIAEVAFYRNIGIPVKQMERFNRFGQIPAEFLKASDRPALIFTALCPTGHFIELLTFIAMPEFPDCQPL